MLEQSELERRVRNYLGKTVELSYGGFRPINTYAASNVAYHVFFYDLEGESGTYIGRTKGIAIPENGNEPYLLFAEGE